MEMNFGKHRGWLVVDLPDSYLAWLVTRNIVKEPDLAGALRIEWENRGSPDPPPREVSFSNLCIRCGSTENSVQYTQDGAVCLPCVRR